MVDGAFHGSGVDIDGLNTLLNVVDGDGKLLRFRNEKGIESTMTIEEYERAIKRCLGPFQDEIGTVIGEIKFLAPSGGKKQKYVVRLRSPVYISKIDG